MPRRSLASALAGGSAEAGVQLARAAARRAPRWSRPGAGTSTHGRVGAVEVDPPDLDAGRARGWSGVTPTTSLHPACRWSVDDRPAQLVLVAVVGVLDRALEVAAVEVVVGGAEVVERHAVLALGARRRGAGERAARSSGRRATSVAHLGAAVALLAAATSSRPARVSVASRRSSPTGPSPLSTVSRALRLRGRGVGERASRPGRQERRRAVVVAASRGRRRSSSTSSTPSTTRLRRRRGRPGCCGRRRRAAAGRGPVVLDMGHPRTSSELGKPNLLRDRPVRVRRDRPRGPSTIGTRGNTSARRTRTGRGGGHAGGPQARRPPRHRRGLRRHRGAGRLQGAGRAARPRRLAGDGPQRHGGARGGGVHHPAAHQRRPGADRQGLPAVRRPADHASSR